MESLLLSVNVTVPLFIMMALGYLLKAIKLVNEGFLNKVNEINFKLFLPVSIFYSLYNADISTVWDGKAVLFCVLSTIAVFVIMMLIFGFLEKDNTKKGVMIQATFRSNYSYIGIPVVMSILGTSTAGLSAIVLACISPLYNSFSVVALEVFRGGKVNVKHLLLNIVKNPLIIASVLGMICMLLKLKFPYVIEKPIGDLSKLCTPLALIALGGFFEFKTLKGNTKHLVIGSALKLIAVPAVFLPIAIAIGLRGEALAATFVALATPTAITSFTMAKMMGGDSQLAGQLVVLQSCLSIATMFGWIYLLNSMGMF